MENLTFALFFAWSLTVLVAIAAGMYWSTQVKPKDPRVIKIGRALAEAQIDLADLRDLYERLMISHKRLRSSAGMAKLRGIKEEKNEDADLRGLSEAEILRSLNMKRRPSQ